jgi:hypothetical protein
MYADAHSILTTHSLVGFSDIKVANIRIPIDGGAAQDKLTSRQQRQQKASDNFTTLLFFY